MLRQLWELILKKLKLHNIDQKFRFQKENEIQKGTNDAQLEQTQEHENQDGQGIHRTIKIWTLQITFTLLLLEPVMRMKIGSYAGPYNSSLAMIIYFFIGCIVLKVHQKDFVSVLGAGDFA